MKRKIQYLGSMLAVVFLVLTFCVFKAQAQSADPKALVAMLKSGGYVVVLRHGDTNHDQTDVQPPDYGNVMKQRRLSDKGRQTATQIGDAVKKQGIAAEDIQTQDVSVYPQTVDQSGKQVITGYQASLSVTVKVHDISKLGEVITAANAAGANNISGPTFTVADPAPARAKAIDEAVADARKSAEAMAKAAGKSVGAVLSMSSSDAGVSPMYSASDAAGAAKSVPIQPGQLDITANVVVVFELK